MYQWLHFQNPEWNSPLLYQVLEGFSFGDIVNTLARLLGSDDVMKGMR